MRRSVNDAPLYYAVTAINRYGSESKPVYSHQAKANQQPSGNSTLLPNDGYSLTIPNFEALPKADNIAIYSMQGTLIATKPFGKVVSIAGIPKGFYELRTHYHTGNTRHIGHFIIK